MDEWRLLSRRFFRKKELVSAVFPEFIHGSSEFSIAVKNEGQHIKLLDHTSSLELLKNVTLLLSNIIHSCWQLQSFLNFWFVVIFYIFSYLSNHIKFTFQYCVRLFLCFMAFSQGQGNYHLTQFFIFFSFLYFFKQDNRAHHLI